MEEDQIIKERKEKLSNFIKQKYAWISYLVLAFIVWIAVYVRTRNLPNLRDVTTGSWTLGPDLDPFLFLRWAKEIIANGSLSAIDTMRYVPLGFNTKGELILLSYLIAYFHKVANAIGFNWSIEQSAVYFPVFMFALTVISFFLLVKKIFIKELGEKNSSIIALISSLFLSLIPVILPRTIAGIPEKESAAFFFMFIAFYFFLTSWQSEKLKFKLIYAVLAGIFTAVMAGVWGGYIYILVTLSLALLIFFFIGQINKERFLLSLTWLATSYILMTFISTRYSLVALVSSTTTLIPIGVISIFALHFLLFSTKLNKYFEVPAVSKYPKQLVTLILAIVLSLILGTVLFGFDFMADKFSDITKPLITPITDRLGVTVAENRQPYFSEWESSFGPHINEIAIFFWLFFLGSIYLCYKMIYMFSTKERIILTSSYAYFLFSIIFSRYDSSSVLNGTNTTSILFYMSGVLALLGTFGYYYYQHYKTSNESIYSKVSFEYILLFSLFFFSIVSARGSVRTIMVLVPSASIIVGYLIVALYNQVDPFKDYDKKTWKLILLAVVIILSIYSAFYFYNASVGTAQSYAPSIYTEQWQKAMSWVRQNTPEDAVFAHWWDYGYWLQSIGERATVLDGGNVITYWNHLMGRHALTGTSNEEAISFLYSHNVTHFLIDPTDIGKYGAFSSIGSDVDYDRASYITTFVKDSRQTIESKNTTTYVYTGTFVLDEDIVYVQNGTRQFFPAGSSAVIAILIEKNSSNQVVSQPKAVLIYRNIQYTVPLMYIYNKELVKYNEGIDSGVFIFPRLIQDSSGTSIDTEGALLYLSSRTVNSQLARHYLYGEKNDYFDLAHSEDDFLVTQLKSQNVTPSDFILYDSFRGPIKIWSLNYPSDIEVNETYLQTTFPDPRLNIAR